MSGEGWGLEEQNSIGLRKVFLGQEEEARRVGCWMGWGLSKEVSGFKERVDDGCQERAERGVGAKMGPVQWFLWNDKSPHRYSHVLS